MGRFLLQGKKRKVLVLAATVIVALAAGAADYLSGKPLSVLPFYMIPVGLAALFLGQWQGIALSVFSAVIYLAADTGLSPAALDLASAWNFVMALVVFLAFSMVLSLLNAEKGREEQLVREDSLTGIANRKSFMETVEGEWNRLKRYKRPFTIAMIDILNLSEVNRLSGAEEGDFLLVFTAKTIKNSVRTSDIPARIGDNEFGILFPESGNDAAAPILEKIRRMLGEITGSQATANPIRYLVNCVTFLEAPPAASDVLTRLSEARERAFSEGENAVHHETYSVKS